jgi:hypothetical protein
MTETPKTLRERVVEMFDAEFPESAFARGREHNDRHKDFCFKIISLVREETIKEINRGLFAEVEAAGRGDLIEKVLEEIRTKKDV